MRIFQLLKYLFYFLLKPKKFMQLANDVEHKRTPKLRKAIGQSFIMVVSCFLISLVIVFLLPLSQQIASWLGIIGTGIILWATLGYLGWEIQSWDGETLPDQINRIWFRWLYIAGTLLLFISILYFKG